jgi:hypothetical protein
MDTEKNRAAWLEALNSGKYNQTRKLMADDTGRFTSYCCLGVACVLTGHEPARGGDLSADYVRTREWLGLDCYQESAFINLNDTRCCSFAEIAQLAPVVFAHPDKDLLKYLPEALTELREAEE